MNRYWLGKKRSDGDKKKMSDSHKGKKHTEEQKRKIGLSQKGKIVSKETRKKISKSHIGMKKPWAISGMKGKHHSMESRKKISKNHSRWNLGKHHSKEQKRKMKENHVGMTGRKQSESMKQKVSKEKSYMWKGGITPLVKVIRHCLKMRQWISDIFTRDDFTCQNCGVRGGILNAHHIKRFALIIEENRIKTIEQALECEELWNLNNGKTLCKKCHNKIPINA